MYLSYVTNKIIITYFKIYENITFHVHSVLFKVLTVTFSFKLSYIYKDREPIAENLST